MGNGNLRIKLCRNFCSYYRPSKKEEFACQGFIVVEKLINKGRNIPFTKSRTEIDPLTKRKLIKAVCTACPFYENDCDFAEKKKEALPCGGFILLGFLVDENIITAGDVAAMLTG